MFRDFFRRLFRRRRRLDRVRLGGTLGPSIELHGTLRGEDDIHMAGHGEGSVQITGSFVLAVGGEWRGNVSAAHVVVFGHVQGNINAREQIEISASGRVDGHIKSPIIAMAEGAVHQGEVRMARRTRVVRFDERRDDKKSASTE